MERSCNFIKKTVEGNEKWFVSRGRKIGPEPCSFLTSSAEDLLDFYSLLLGAITFNLSPGTIPNSINAVVSTKNDILTDICLKKTIQGHVQGDAEVKEVTYEVLINMNSHISKLFLYPDWQKSASSMLIYFPRTITLPNSIQSVFGEIPDMIFIGYGKLWHIDV